MHLTPEQLVDLAEHAEPESSDRHLAACDACRQQLAEMRATMTAVSNVGVPEPSPLFWNHLSSRISGAVQDDRGASFAERARRLWADRPSLDVAAICWAGAAALAALIMVVRVAMPPTGSIPVPPIAPGPAGGIEAASGIDEASLSLVADLAADLDWDAAADAGLTTYVGADANAVAGLNEAERRELRRLLQDELKPSRRGV